MADIPLSSEMEGKFKVSQWSRNTVADGSWLQKYTIGKLKDRDIFLADAIESASSATDSAISALSAKVNTVSSNLDTFSGKVESSADDLNRKINEEINRSTEVDSAFSSKINTLEAATDVIAVFGTFENFSAESGSLVLTDKDIIKVLRDDQYSTSGEYQVYYQWDEDNGTWSAIGSLEPYYSVSATDSIIAGLSSTISSNYLSANDTAVQAGKNIIVTEIDDVPQIKIETSADVEFDTVSAMDVSGVNAVFDEYSGTNIRGATSTSTIDNLIGSAIRGSAASAWITNTANYVRHNENDLCIGSNYSTNLTATGNSTALGNYVSANNYSFGIGFAGNANDSTLVDTKSFAVGDNNSASWNTFIIGPGNSALSTGANAQNRFILGNANRITDTVNNGYVIGNQNILNNSNSISIGYSNDIQVRESEPANVFIFGYGNTAANLNKFTTILGYYSKTYQSSDNTFIIGNGIGTDTTARHNLFELSNDTLGFNPAGSEIDITYSGISITHTAAPTGSEPDYRGYNYTFIPFKEMTNVSSNTIYSSAISAKIYNLYVENDATENVSSKLVLNEPSASKSTRFKIRKKEIFGSDWYLDIYVHKNYELKLNGAPPTGTTAQPWKIGYTNSYDEPPTEWTDIDCYVEKAATAAPSVKNYYVYRCSHINDYACFNINIDTVDKFVTVIKGGFDAM